MFTDNKAYEVDLDKSNFRYKNFFNNDESHQDYIF